MTVATRVILLQVIACAAVAFLGILTYYAFENAGFYKKRTDVAHHVIEALIEVANSSSQYSEDLAEYLLSGSAPDKTSLAEARELMRGSINKLEKAIIVEELFLSDSNQPADPATEVFEPQSGDDSAAPEEFVSERQRVEKIWGLFRALNGLVEEAVQLFESDKREEAIKLFDMEIDGIVDAELDRFLAAAIADEEQEHTDIDNEVRSQIKFVSSIAGGAVVLTIMACGLLGYWVIRSLQKPMAELLRGAEAFGRGNLNHQIEVTSSDELGTLALRFNQMADALRVKQDELGAARTNLEAQVQERTSELATMNQNLTDLGELRTRFLADISHELRTPLTALRGEAEITLRHGRKSAETYRDALNRIVQQSGDMTKLIDDLLLLARSETEDVLFTPKPMLIGPTVSDAARDATILGSRKKIAIDAEISPEPVWIVADAQRLKQAVMILLDNAIKYSNAGQRIELKALPENGQMLIAVSDEGSGIADKDLPHVFKRFYRGQGTATSSGSGLGLSIAKWIVEKHGGDIDIESDAKSGTQVCIRIPIQRRPGDGENIAGRG